jgi:hypothetical protein
MGALENADRGGKGSTAAQLAPVSNCVGVGAILGEIKAWEGCSPRVRTPGRLENDEGAMELRAEDGEAPARQQMGRGLDDGRRMAGNRQ